MEKKIRIKITTVSSSNPVSVLKGEGSFRSKDNKTLITHTDKDNSKTSVIITDGKILLSRKAELYSLKIPVRSEQETLGIMGEENTFKVIGKTSSYEVDNFGGRVYLEYTLPDLSDEPTDFKIDIEFKF